MSEKRRDNRNRILRSGESQRKDGRYAYKYTDTFGKVQFVYVILSILVDTFFTRISIPKQQRPWIHNISAS